MNEKPKGKEVVKPTKEDQPEYQEKIIFLVSTTFQAIIVSWCLIVLSLGYVKLPNQLFGVDLPDQPRIDNTFCAALLGNILAGWGISVGAGSSKKKKKDNELGGGGGPHQTIVIKQPIELITKPATATKLNDLDRIS
tara:strand:- start:2472 stop:2882 length:411 start_codon:yes stop_codon:yes gene_type:complete